MSKKFKDVLNKLDIDEKFTTKPKQSKHKNRFLSSIVAEKDWNYQGDLLHLPTTKNGYKYLLVITDVATRNFDFEPMKTTKSEEAVVAFKKIIKRDYLKMPEISIKTDGGAEFKKDFNQYLIDNDVAHITAFPGRHSQMSMVESLNKELGRIFNGIMNKKENESNKTNREWDTDLDLIRKELNNYRERDVDDIKKLQEDKFFDPSEMKKQPKFKEGDVVYYALTEPKTIIGHKNNDKKFRVGDRTFSFDAKQIISILYYPDMPYIRYKLKGLQHISFTENELMLADSDETFVIEKIVSKKTRKDGTRLYKVKYKGQKTEKDYNDEKDLRDNGFGDYIDAYEEKASRK
jgi:hypothetical protein